MWFTNFEIKNRGNGFLNGKIEIPKTDFSVIRESWLQNFQLQFSAVYPIKFLIISSKMHKYKNNKGVYHKSNIKINSKPFKHSDVNMNDWINELYLAENQSKTSKTVKRWIRRW